MKALCENYHTRIVAQSGFKSVQGSANVLFPGCENVSKTRNKIIDTWERPYSQTLLGEFLSYLLSIITMEGTSGNLTTRLNNHSERHRGSHDGAGQEPEALLPTEDRDNGGGHRRHGLCCLTYCGLE